jgi:hypothetical protein
MFVVIVDNRPAASKLWKKATGLEAAAGVEEIPLL